MLTFPRADLIPSESGERGGETAYWVVGYVASEPACRMPPYAICHAMPYAMHEKEDRSRLVDNPQKGELGEWRRGIRVRGFARVMD